ncbi:hypothetical protein K493DRAFT_314629 [Basidiobolus meristosporus CBS 931.73]|uniref:Uncharacterized protein n=1 Tax=Basidiobolus meristosporus CBS 931.73 TaxID=1314790 RepID=A0A1Y1YE53_9FUNG|nr:hypothetical protein K493DRAFT_314629 [Basidiobolus meristosporus CBS 931.73]|eukprot:ORX96203.1 hypothetical protein K493DRAFT_314629 [Basidiobolus meristosporus CBS 931.73]
MPNPMDAATNLLGGFVDKLEPAIREHVERNVDETKAVLVQRLPPAIQEIFSNGGTGERSLDRNLVDAIMNKVQNKFGNVLENIQEKLRTISREQVDRASTGTVDFLTQAIVRESKECVTSKVSSLLAHQKKKGEEGSRGVNLDFITQGRQAAISRAMEKIEPKVHESGLEIYNKLVSHMPEAVQQLLTPGGSGEATRGIFDDKFRRILDRVREVVQQVVGNIMPTFEKSILQNIQRELENKVPDQNLVLGFVQKFASKIELGKLGNLGTLLGGVLGAGAVGSASTISNNQSAGGSSGDYANSSQGQSNSNSGYSPSMGSQSYGQSQIQGDNYSSVSSQGNYGSSSNQGNYNQSNYNQPLSQSTYNQPQSSYNQSSGQNSFNQPPNQGNYSQQQSHDSHSNQTLGNNNQPQGQGNYGQGNYNQPQGQGNYGQSQGQGGYNQPQGQSNYSQPQSQGSYNQPQGQDNYAQTSSQGGYNQPQGQSNYGQMQGQGSYNQPQGQSSYDQSQGQGSYNQPQSQGNYGKPQGQGNYRPSEQGNSSYQATHNGSNYEAGGGYNGSQGFQSGSREISNPPSGPQSYRANYPPGGFVGLSSIPTPENYQQQQQPEKEQEIFPGGFYLPKQ